MQDDSNSRLPQTNQKFDVPDDAVQADLDLQDEKDQALQDSFSNETAAETMQMPESQLKEGLDKIAFDERDQATTPNQDDSGDDWREHVEDMDENDKEH